MSQHHYRQPLLRHIAYARTTSHHAGTELRRAMMSPDIGQSVDSGPLGNHQFYRQFRRRVPVDTKPYHCVDNPDMSRAVDGKVKPHFRRQPSQARQYFQIVAQPPRRPTRDRQGVALLQPEVRGPLKRDLGMHDNYRAPLLCY